MSSLLRAIDATLRGRPAAAALAAGAAASGAPLQWTFGDVDARARRAQAWLRARGIGAGACVVAHLGNEPAFVDLLLACLRDGVILVPANAMYRAREMAHIVGLTRPRVVVTREPAVFGPDVATVTPEAWTETRNGVATVASPWPAMAFGDDTPALVVFTSGTTGRAKGAVLSHGNLLANARHLVDAWRITADDRYLAVLPLFHVHGLANGLGCWLLVGCQMRLEAKFDAALAPEWFAAFRPTLFFGVPTMYVRMLDWPDAVATRVGESVRLFVSGSAPLPAHVLDAFRAKFGSTILERYGMSETLMNLGNPYDGERRAGSVGLPFRGVRARIVDDQGRSLGDNVVGELEVQGPNVFQRYWSDPDATHKAFHDGWFRTGDLAERAADGYYTLRGRRGDLIIAGGFNIYPREIEEVLLEQRGVREAVVVGAADPVRGETPIAYVVTDPGGEAGAPSDESLRAACASALAAFKVPRAFIRLESLPRNALGKVQKHLLPPWPQ